MTFAEIIEQLPAILIYKGSDYSDFVVRHVVAGDLMSDVLVTEYDDLVMISSLNSEQIMRTANMVGARGILLVNGKIPSSLMKNIAEEDDITLLSTSLPMYEASIALGHLLGPSDPISKGALK